MMAIPRDKTIKTKADLQEQLKQQTVPHPEITIHKKEVQVIITLRINRVICQQLKLLQIMQLIGQ